MCILFCPKQKCSNRIEVYFLWIQKNVIVWLFKQIITLLVKAALIFEWIPFRF